MATLVFQVSAMAQGCAMCRAGYESSPDIKVMAPAINHGIVFLMGAPYVLLGTVGLQNHHRDVVDFNRIGH